MFRCYNIFAKQILISKQGIPLIFIGVIYPFILAIQFEFGKNVIPLEWQKGNTVCV